MKRPRSVRAMPSVCVALIGWFVAAGPLASIGAQPTPTAPEARTIALKDANAMEAEFRIGAAGKILVEFKFADGKTLKLEGAVKADNKTTDRFKSTAKKVPMTEGYIEFNLAAYTGKDKRFVYHSRPRLVRYTDAQQADLAKVWDTLPAASQCWVPMQVRTNAAGTELWLDGRYCGQVPGEGKLAEVVIRPAAGGELRNTRAFTLADTGLYLPLDVRHIARPGAMKEARVSLKPGPQTVKGVPMTVTDGAGNVDVGEAKMMQGPQVLEVNQYTSSTSLDGMKESLHFSVPQAFYHRAWVLCAVEPDPKKDPVLTTRLTRFGWNGRGGAMADTTLTLPRGKEKSGAGIQQVGSVIYATAGKKEITAPLYLVCVDLKTGDILDLVGETKDRQAAMKIGPYLDFEFLGKTGVQEFNVDRRRMPLATSRSAVHVFGVTLEKSPVEIRLKPSQPGNVFHNDEVPETTVSLHAVQPTKCVLRWEITDVKGVKLAAERKEVSFDAAGREAEIKLPLGMPQVGWYGLHITVNDERDATLLKHEAAFALLGKDTRTAGYDSPFGTWWSNGEHYTVNDPAIAGPLLLKAGLRRPTAVRNRSTFTEADLAPWKLTNNQVPWLFGRGDLKNWPAAEARVEKVIAEDLRRFPHCRYVLLFHETYGSGMLPPELYNEKYVPKNADVAKDEDDLYDLALRVTKFYRVKFPQLKIIAGNSWGSMGIAAVLMRRGFPKDRIDYLGSEVMSLTGAPERLNPYGMGSLWMLGETGRRFDYDIPLTSCYEFSIRAERALGPQRQAEWSIRDVMMCLAHRFPTISSNCLEDAGNAYYDSMYAATGLCQRNPLHYPKSAYVALATLTKALDSAKLTRQITTGSSSAHAREFTRGDEHVYALWTLRGECDMQVELPADDTLTLTDFYGAQRRQASKAKRLIFTASSAVSYFTSPSAVKAITAGARRFPQQSPPPDAKIVTRMDNAADWQLVEAKALTQTLRRPGKFTLKQQNDPEKGACLELTLQKAGDLPAVVAEYATLKLNRPAPIPGRPHSIGMWVKGNSSWGRIIWEIEDAKGKRFRSDGGYDGGDWGNYSALDFDGWCFMRFPLTNDSPFTHLEVAPGIEQWRVKADHRFDYPLKLTGIYVVTYRQSLNLTKMAPVTKSLRFKNLIVMGNTK